MSFVRWAYRGSQREDQRSRTCDSGTTVSKRSALGNEDSRNRMSIRYVSCDRLRGLKALQRFPAPKALSTNDRRPPLLYDAQESHSRTRAPRNKPDQLARILGATTKA